MFIKLIKKGKAKLLNQHNPKKNSGKTWGISEKKNLLAGLGAGH